MQCKNDCPDPEKSARKHKFVLKRYWNVKLVLWSSTAIRNDAREIDRTIMVTNHHGFKTI
jgi:hypothetical protein